MDSEVEQAMRPKLYLHIGYPKTGTTAIQHFLARNADILREKAGFLYPDSGRLGSAHYGITAALKLGNYQVGQNSIVAEDLGRALVEEVRASGCQRVIISSENFILASDIGLVAEFFAEFEVFPIVYLRRHDGWFESAFNQSVRMVSNPPWEANAESFVEVQIRRKALPFDYFELVSAWADAFAKDHVIVRPYEKGQNQPSIYDDFLQAVGVSALNGLEREDLGGGNESVDADMLFVVDCVQRMEIVEPLKREIVRRIVRSKPSSGLAQSFFSPQLRARLLSRYGLGYRRLATEYLGRADGRLFYDAEPAMDATWSQPAEPGWKEVVGILVKALTEPSTPK